MTKLTYFKFNPNEWLTGSVQLLTDEEKGTFIDICSMVMKEGGTINYKDKRLSRKLRLDDATLCDRMRAYTELELVVCDGTNLGVKFISEQICDYHEVCDKNKANAKKRWSTPCDPMPIRKEKKRKEKKNTPKIIHPFVHRINQLFNRKDATEWSKKEQAQLNDLVKRADFKNELLEIETLYKSGYKFKRKNMETLFNNWTGELDRARENKKPVEPRGWSNSI